MSQFDQAYFDRCYHDYFRQNPRRKMRFYERLLRTHLPPRAEPRRILEVGCGLGPFLAHLGSTWIRSGMDRSEYGVREARRAIPGASLAVADASAIPMRGPFDAIVSFDVIEHVPDLEAVGRGIRDVLAAGGVFIFVVPVYDGPLGPLVHLLDKDPTHIHKRSRDFWIAWACRYFAVIDTVGIVRYLVPGGPYVHWASRLAVRFGSAIAVCCRQKPGA